MTWTAPMTAVAGNVFTAAQFNQYVRDNLNQTAPALATTAGQYFVATGTNALAARSFATATVAASQTSTNTAYVDLATPGPAVTVTTGVAALVGLYNWSSNSGGAGNPSFMSFAVSGASTIPGNDNTSVLGVNTFLAQSYSWVLLTGLTSGSNTFTCKYRVPSNTGTWINRTILVMPL